ncbi:hypothetical protein C2I19_21410, partial [Chromobacterium alticapitis]
MRPTTDTAYNGLGQAATVSKIGADGKSFTATETHYGAGGRVAWTKDAEGNTTWYDYDAVGNISRTRRDRLLDSQGGKTQDVTAYGYNAAKQQTAQLQLLDATNGLYSETRYNAWGQITAKFARGTAAGA